MKPNAQEVVEDGIYFIPRNEIHPDPEQPRVSPDDELQASIDEQGIITPILVRPHPEIENDWVIIDGERRWRGAVKLAEIPCRIRLDLEDGVDRLITQLSANTGKPLTPVEQARAFKLLLDDQDGLSQAELAKRLGIPRSTIGDRIRLIELHSVWLDALTAGRLQVSHAPILSTFSAVPAEYQAKAAKSFFEDYRTKRYLQGGGSVPIDEMPRLLFVAFRDYIKETGKTPGYRGPTIEIKDPYSTHKSKYAADITLWRPCFRAYEKKERKARSSGSRSSSYSGGGSWLSAPQKAVKALKAAGFDPPLRKVGNIRVLAEKGEAIIHSENGWPKDLHPKVLLAKIDPSTITYVKGNFGGDELFTSDIAAVTAAREAYRQHVANVAEKELAPLRKQLTSQRLTDYAVTGPGVLDLLSFLNPERGTPKVVAMALGLTVAGGVSNDDSFEDDDEDYVIIEPTAISDAARLLSALAAIRALDIKVPDDWQIGQLIRKGIGDVAFKLPDPPKSKKQQKREARAAGKQVGDPNRAQSSWPENPNWTDTAAPVEQLEEVEA